MAVQMRRSARLEDPGAELLDRVGGWWDDYGRIALIALGVVAVVVVGVVFTMRSRASAESQASAELMKADLLFWQGDYPHALQSARQTYQQYPGTPSGADAHRIAGDSQFWQANFKDAIAEYRQYLDRVKKGPLADAGRRSMAYALEGQGGGVQPSPAALQEAEKTYLSLVGAFDRESSAEFLMGASRCAAAQHHTADQVADLQRVDREFGETSYANRARLALAELQASGVPVPAATSAR